MLTTRFNPLTPDVLCNPYPSYAQLRQDDPVHWGNADDANLPGRWYVTRFDDVTTILKDQRFGREVAKVLPPAAQPIVAEMDKPLANMAEAWMILRDPPIHTRLRSLVQNIYTPRRVAELRPQIEAIAQRLIDNLLTAGPPLDLLTHFSLPLTVMMTAHMLGLPGEDYDQLMPWSRALAAVIDLNQADDVRQLSRQAVAELQDYLRDIISARRRQPQHDLISLMLQPEAAAKLTEDELLGSLTHLLFVGNDPVMHEIGMAVITLLHHPDQMAQLRANPDLIQNAVDELLRYDSPVQMTFRYALTNVEFQGKQLRTGDHVALVLGAANRDPACCVEPDRLEITRTVGQVAHFGAGVHYCLGAPLARLEGQIALNSLLQRLPNLALATDELTWQKTVAVRGVVELPVRF
ncbi:MAG: cytochrome P450 [Chloroflexi bacterium]|nr:cytochrome P450 [Chloroflexota bacterium]